jgi:myo-inositol catabolism protein IolC
VHPTAELLILAMDHRASLLTDVYGIEGNPTAEQIAAVSAHKGLIFDGLLRAIDGGVDVARAGVLVDERYGSDVAVRARAAGIDLAVPIERSGEPLFLLEYGTFGDGEWMRHVEEFSPNQVKVLVRDNPEASSNRELQFDRLVTVSNALRKAGRTFLIELLVPATPAQLESVGSDPLRYDRELRAGLTVRVIEQMQDEGIEPGIWKIEGRPRGAGRPLAADRFRRRGVPRLRDRPQHLGAAPHRPPGRRCHRRRTGGTGRPGIRPLRGSLGPLVAVPGSTCGS